MSFYHLPKKSLGQNFLKDEYVLEQISLSMTTAPGFHPGLQIVEIGPGLGDLTKHLLKIAPLRAIELDSSLLPQLRKRFLGFKLELIEADALALLREQKLCEKPYWLCANLPYYAASAMLLELLKDPLCKGFCALIQREVALRFIGSNFCALSVLAEAFADVEILFDVDAKCFSPQPKVISSLLRGVKKDCELDYDALAAFLKIFFKSPRKQLKAVLPHLPAELLSKRPAELDVKLILDIFKKDEYERGNSTK